MSDTLRGLIETQARERPDAPALLGPGRDPKFASQGVELVTVPGRREAIFGKACAPGLAAALRRSVQSSAPPTRREPRK